jgi:hypothetical protein
MGQRDAFGREIDEDTLAEVGWRTPERTQPAPEWVQPKPAQPSSAFDAGEAWSLRTKPEQAPDTPAPAPTPAFQAPPPRAPARPRRRRRGGFSRLIFLVVLLVIAGSGAGSLFTLGKTAVDSGRNALRDAIPTPIVEDAGPGDSDAGSFLEPAGLRKAMAKLPAGRVTILTIRPNGLDATVIADGRTKLVHMDAAGNVTTVGAPVEIPGKSVKLDPAAPGRIVRTVTRRTGKSPAAISQLVLANGTWTAQLDGGAQFTANAKGTKVRRIT